MEFDGDVLTVDIDMSMQEIIEFEEFIRSRIDYIETIEVNENGALQSSAFLSLLTSLKKTRPELNIPYLQKGISETSEYGKIHWICYD